MPIPAAAGLLAATVHFFNAYPVNAWWVAIPWLVLVGLSAFLMVSTWRFWSAKEINFSRRHPFQLLVPLAIVAYVMIRYSNTALFLAALVYMFSGIWARAAYGWSRRRRKRPADCTRRRALPRSRNRWAQDFPISVFAVIAEPADSLTC